MAVLALLPWGLRATASAFVFPVHRAPAVPPPPSLSLIETSASDGAIVKALYSSPVDAAPVVVVFHGNAETMVDSTWLAEALRARGLGSLLVEYRGYGLSADQGPATEDGVYRDAEAALDALQDRGVPPARIKLYGFSLGSGVAAEMARRGRASSLVLVAPFTSVPDVVTAVVPVVPARLLMRERFETLAKVSDIRVPSLIIHGSDDEVVPFWMGKALAERLPHAKLVSVARGRHGDLFARERDRLLEAIVMLGS